MSKNRRIGVLINPGFQWKVVGHFAFSGLIITAFFFAANSYFFWKFAKKGEAMALPPEHVFFRFLAEQKLTMNWIFLFAFIAVSVFSVVFGLYFSHKISGPIARIQLWMQAWGSGEKVGPEFRFRKGDYFQELAQTIEVYFKKFQNKKPSLRKVK